MNTLPAEQESILGPCGQAALRYVEMGWSVIPLKARSKVPATRHGLNDWTNDPRAVVECWTKHPEFNVAVVCGQSSHGLLVIDLDVNEAKGKDGKATLEEWETTHGKLPETITSITGSDGIHLFYRTNMDIRPSANATLGVDIRCEKSYVVAPPSIHPNGQTYEWSISPEDMPIAEVDGNVLAFVSYVQRNGTDMDNAGGRDRPHRGFKLPETIDGDRNVALFKYASQLREFGRSDSEIELLVIGANATRCRPPMDQAEVKKIIRSAMRYEPGEDNDAMKAGSFGPTSTKPWWRENQNGTHSFLHDVMGDAIIRDHHACLIGGAPAVWTGKRYELGTDAIDKMCIVLDKTLKSAQRGEVIKYVQRIAPDKNQDLDFDGRPWVAFQNGCIDITDGDDTLHEPSPEMFITNVIPWDYQPPTSTAQADAFLSSLACGDDDIIESLRETIGIVMCSKRVVSQCPMLIGKAKAENGDASNGKSTFLNVLRSILGPQNVSSLDIATLGQRFQQQRIVGKLANLGDDIPSDFIKGNELMTFKHVVTGDTLYTDVKSADGFEFVPNATMIFSMNAVPRLGDASGGILRRLFFIPFRAKFVDGEPGCDPDMVRKLSNHEAIMELVSVGLWGLMTVVRTHRMTPNQAMAEEMAEVAADNNSVLQWIEEEAITRKYVIGTPVRDLFDEYTRWAEAARISKPFQKRSFSKSIATHFVVDRCVARPKDPYDTSKVAQCFVNPSRN